MSSEPTNFIEQIIDADLKSGRIKEVVTRFPPEPNGFLHIGHPKSICLNFGIAEKFGGRCHLRFDDTNPASEDVMYVDSIKNDIRWLGFDWGEHLYNASDYFGQLHDFAVELIESGKAYVCDLSDEDIRLYRGTVTEPGKPSPFRDRCVKENLELFAGMRAGEFDDGSKVLRAKIDLAAANMKMRDPLMYRIRRDKHHRTGNEWVIYPFYDFAHCLSDAIEGITHSLCTLEFENNRELYDWYVANVSTSSTPRQIEFARLNLTSTVMSKRHFLKLVENGTMEGWDDPRLPTVAGIRRRGVTAEAVRDLCDRVGVAKANSVVDFGQFEFCIRNDLNQKAPRVMAVLHPLKVVISNWPEDKTEKLTGSLWPEDVPKEETRTLPFTRELYIERSDFLENPPKKYHRLQPGGAVRLRYAYIIQCDEVVKNGTGEVAELRCSYDPETKSGLGSKRKVKGTIHWVSAKHAVKSEVRLYERLFVDEHPSPDSQLNPNSLTTVSGALLEPYLGSAKPGTHFQFERHGYFYVDPTVTDAKIFNRTVTLRDSWAKATAASVGKHPEAPKSVQVEQKERSFSQEAESYAKKHGIQLGDAQTLVDGPEARTFFESAVAVHDQAQSVANWVVNEVMREMKQGALRFDGPVLAELVALVDDKSISSKVAKQVFDALVKNGGSPKSIVEERGLGRIADPKVLEPMIVEIVATHSQQKEQYLAGKSNLMGFFVGKVMAKSQGRADAKVVTELLNKHLT